MNTLKPYLPLLAQHGLALSLILCGILFHESLLTLLGIVTQIPSHSEGGWHCWGKPVHHPLRRKQP